jgi:hypothetical protein
MKSRGVLGGQILKKTKRQKMMNIIKRCRLRWAVRSRPSQKCIYAGREGQL